MKFLFTLRAYGKLEALCPTRRISELDRIAVTRDGLAQIISILDEDHTDPQVIAAHSNFEALAREALATIKASKRPTIEALPIKPGGKKIEQNYAWLCFRALRIGAGWPGALELPVGLLYDMIAAEQIYSGAANEKPRLSYAEAMALK